MKTHADRHSAGRLGCIVAIVLLLTSLPVASDEDSVAAVESADGALHRALLLSGFVSRDHQREYAAASAATSTNLTDSTTPFLGEYASGRRVWRVILDEATPMGDSGATREWVTDIEIYVDSAEGHILKIVCNNEPLDQALDLEPLAVDAEQQLLRGQEEYVGFPSEPPTVTFAEAALACAQLPTSARQVIGQYVLLKFGDRPIRPVWVIQLRGIPPITPSVPHGASVADIPVHSRNRIRQVVDGITGRLLYDALRPNVGGNVSESK